MNVELVRRWVAALRSDKYRQTHGVLKRTHVGSEYCCLGVLCELAGVEWNQQGQDIYARVSDGDQVFASDIELPGPLMRDVGLDSDFMTELTIYNDGGELGKDDRGNPKLVDSHTFKEIADIVEERLLGEQSS